MPAELLAAWSFEANPVIDETGNGHDMTLSGGTILTAPDGGAFGRGLTQTGSEVYTAFAMPPELQPAQRSWMANVVISGEGLGWIGEFFNADAPDGGTGVFGLLDLRGVGGTFQFRAKDSSNTERHVNLTPPGAFVNICATYDGTDLRVYTDGSLAGSVAAPAIWAATHFRMLDGLGSAAKVDDMRIFSGALTPEEIDVWRFLPANEMPPGAPSETGRLKYESAPGVWTSVPLKYESAPGVWTPVPVKTEASPGDWEALP